MAAEAGFADVVEALLEAGADPDAPGQVSGRPAEGGGRGGGSRAGASGREAVAGHNRKAQAVPPKGHGRGKMTCFAQRTAHFGPAFATLLAFPTAPSTSTSYRDAILDVYPHLGPHLPALAALPCPSPAPSSAPQDGKTAMDYATQVSFHASLSRVGQYRAVATLLQAAQERGEAAAAAPEDAAAAAEEQQRGRAAAGGGAVEAVAVVVAPAGAEAGSEKALAPTLSGAGAALLRRSGVFEDVDCGGSLGPLERSGLSVRSVTAAGGGGTPGVAARTKAVAEWLAAGHGEGGAEGAEAPAA